MDRAPMIVRGIVRRSAYYDSAALMRIQQALREMPGIDEAGVVMATAANAALLRQAGLDPAVLAGAAGTQAGLPGPSDLVIMIRGESARAVETALAGVDALLARKSTGAGGGYRPHSVAAAAGALPGANVALISVAGRFADGVARESLDAGLHVMLFSDNVSIEDEIRLKRAASDRGRLVMGPDCGTAVVGGAALGFANRTRRGDVGIVGAAGTGIQEIASFVHRLGAGVSQAIGTGGRDLSRGVAGASTRAALAVLSRDPATRVLVVVSKPPAAPVAEAVLRDAASTGKPVVVAFVGAAAPGDEAAGGTPAPLWLAGTLEDAARLAAALSRHDEGGGGGNGHGEGTVAMLRDDRESLVRIAARAREASARLAPPQQCLRGLMSGGTLCSETVAMLAGTLRPLYTNVPAGEALRHEGTGPSRGHTVLDLGDDLFTVGRLHPMIDSSLRVTRLRQEVADPETAVVLLDIVLGLGVPQDPAGPLAAATADARARAAAQGRTLAVVASVCGTDDDPQHRSGLVARLEKAGVLVEESNARASLLAGAIAARITDPDTIASWCPESRVLRVRGPSHGAAETRGPGVDAGALLAEARVVNVGLTSFADSLRSQGVPVVEVDWRPPAGGDDELRDLLDRLS